MSFKYTLAAVTAVGLTTLTAPAQAALVNIPLEFDFLVGDSTTSSGTGFFTIDDSNLAPNTVLGDGDLSGLEGFSATFTDLISTPSPTTFDLLDLNSWIYRTDADGNFLDINFFTEGNSNVDGYTLNGSDPSIITLSGNGQSTVYGINPGDPVPVPSTPEPTTLIGLILMGGAGLLSKRQKKH